MDSLTAADMRSVGEFRLLARLGAGTPSYMSPEQVEAFAAGPASDTFSLGSVLAFAAPGAAPPSRAPPAAGWFRAARPPRASGPPPGPGARLPAPAAAAC